MLTDRTSGGSLGSLKKSSKRDLRKRELAEHTLTVLARLGYAQASLRDIADQAGISLGSIHYYFANKVELICYCTVIYKEGFMEQLGQTISTNKSRAEIAQDFIDALATAIENDSESHRLWYDMRSQAMFDNRFAFSVNEVEHSLISVFGRLVSHLQIVEVEAIDLYAIFDGLFRYYLQRKLMGDGSAANTFRIASSAVLERLTDS